MVMLFIPSHHTVRFLVYKKLWYRKVLKYVFHAFWCGRSVHCSNRCILNVEVIVVQLFGCCLSASEPWRCTGHTVWVVLQLKWGRSSRTQNSQDCRSLIIITKMQKLLSLESLNKPPLKSVGCVFWAVLRCRWRLGCFVPVSFVAQDV